MNTEPVLRNIDSGARTHLRDDTKGQCFIVFVGGEPFGLPVECVQTIFQIEAVTPVPLGPREVAGLVNLRGKIVTAVSLRRRLRMPDIAEMKSRPAIGMECCGENFALIVDEVGDVISLDPKAQIRLPPHLDQHRTKLSASAYQLENGILSVLDVGSVFEFQRRV